MTAPKNPAPIGLPLTVSTAEVVKNMGLKDKPEPAAAKRGMVRAHHDAASFAARILWVLCRRCFSERTHAQADDLTLPEAVYTIKTEHAFCQPERQEIAQFWR